MNAVNDAPIVLQPLDDRNLLEDLEAATIVLSPVFTDLDGDSLIYNVSSNIEGIISIEMNSDTLIVSNIPDQFGGPVTITVTADDQNGAVPAIDHFDVTIEAVNDPPILSVVDDQQIDEDAIFIYSLEGTDPDGDQLFFTSEMDTTAGSLSIDGNLLKVV